MMMDMIDWSATAINGLGFVPHFYPARMAWPDVSGQVIHGNKLGRQLGIPTANIAVPVEDMPPFGIYAVQAELADCKIGGVASWGGRPNFDNGAPLLEVHLFDFSQEIYGKTLQIRFVSFLRDEESFASIEGFLQQIQTDIAQARQILDPSCLRGQQILGAISSTGSF